MNEQGRKEYQQLANQYSTETTPSIESWIDALHEQGHGISTVEFIAVCRYVGWMKYKGNDVEVGNHD